MLNLNSVTNNNKQSIDEANRYRCDSGMVFFSRNLKALAFPVSVGFVFRTDDSIEISPPSSFFISPVASINKL